MAKYVVDLDSFVDCLDLVCEGTLNGRPYLYLQNLKAYIERFPKYKVEETVSIEMKTNIEVSE